MTRQEALDNFAVAFKAKEAAWKAVRANTTDYELDDVLRAKAFEADAKLKEAYQLRMKYAPSI